MGLLGLIFGQKRVQLILNDSTVVQFDCSIKEVHSRESPATEFPIEDGTDVSDHIIQKPFSLELTGMISDTPIGDAGSLISEAATTLTSGLSAPLGVIASGASGAIGSALFSALGLSNSPSVAAYLQLLNLQEQAEGLTVLTSLKRYEDMYITSISVPRDAETGKAILFTVKLSQLMIVSPFTTVLSALANAAFSAAESDGGETGSNISQKFKQGYNTSTSALNAVSPKGVAGGAR